jgi:hypothetical protein
MRHVTFGILLLLLPVNSLLAVDYRVEPLAETPPAGELAEGIATLLSSQAVRVIRGSKTEFCDIWLCKELTVQPDFKPTAEVLYPFTPGQLIGAIRFSRRGSDFRDQRINKGLYTLRYAQQPVDGAHLGTSLTRDFALLIQADRDQSADLLDYEKLTEDSIEAAGTSHPCLLSMRRVSGTKTHGSIRHDEDRELWIVALQGETKTGDQAGKLPIELVVVGASEE